MLKICGMIFVIVASSLTGAALSSNLSKRVQALETAILLLEKMRTFLRYGQVPTTELIGQLADSENFRLFPFLSSCKDKLGQGYLFPEAWRRSLSEWKDSALTARDMEILESVAEVLGGSDSESQSNTLELTVSLLEQNLQEALEAKNTNGKLYRSLGVLIGIGAAVFMI